MLYFLDTIDCSNPDLKYILGIVHNVFQILQIGIPIILLIIGTVDLGKAVMAGDEKEIKSSTQLLMKRAMAAVVVFLLVYIVQLVTRLVGGNDWRNCWPGASPVNVDNNNQNNGSTGNDTGVSYLYY